MGSRDQWRCTKSTKKIKRRVKRVPTTLRLNGKVGLDLASNPFSKIKKCRRWDSNPQSLGELRPERSVYTNFTTSANLNLDDN